MAFPEGSTTKNQQQMAVDVLLGLQWGDEGKGKLADVFSTQYDLIARFQGGPNAGHTLEFDGRKFVLNTVPSGVFSGHSMNLIGNGVVIDVIGLKAELDHLKASGYDLLAMRNLLISRRAHLILPTHRLLDAASERQLGDRKIGSTLKGIGPAYRDKAGRTGLRIGDITRPDFPERYRRLTAQHVYTLQALYRQMPDFEAEEQAFFEAVDLIRQFPLVDADRVVADYLRQGKKILAEGAQGTLLDMDFGAYPFVTSSNTTAAGACTGLGVAPRQIGEVIGVVKAYATRVGGGPFPTELLDESGDLLRRNGREFGSVSGRPRRTGWLDLPALKYAVRLNGVTKLVLTKADVLSGFATLQVCTHYRINGEEVDYMPYAPEEAEPVFAELTGWTEDLTSVTDRRDLPEALKKYIRFLEAHLDVPVTWVSVGPDRRQTLANPQV